ncbi:hypothetical protein GCM10009544_03570 [Streptomyces stramineus]|uniref:Uncharacterized protein n=1 Tax=Streptomyces stramineus TaxID=173861 RepID=A0ABN0ZDT1_9ACTN
MQHVAVLHPRTGAVADTAPGAFERCGQPVFCLAPDDAGERPGPLPLGVEGDLLAVAFSERVRAGPGEDGRGADRVAGRSRRRPGLVPDGKERGYSTLLRQKAAFLRSCRNVTPEGTPG